MEKKRKCASFYMYSTHYNLFMKKKMINLKDNSSDSDVVSQKWEGLFPPK